MASKKRERLDLIYDILISIRKSGYKIGPTRLLNLSNLSSQMFKEYVFELLEKEFIEEEFEKKRKYFTLTKKGDEFIEKYREIKSVIENFGL